MKTRFNQLVVLALFSLIMLGGNVSAEGTEVAASSRENIVEPALEIENWMVDEEAWANSENFFAVESEENLQLEDWMVNENNWYNTENSFEQATEESLELVSWMIDNSKWNNNQSVLDADSDLEVESWMLDENIWNR